MSIMCSQYTIILGTSIKEIRYYPDSPRGDMTSGLHLSFMTVFAYADMPALAHIFIRDPKENISIRRLHLSGVPGIRMTDRSRSKGQATSPSPTGPTAVLMQRMTIQIGPAGSSLTLAPSDG